MNCHAASARGTLFMPHPDVPSSVELKVGVILKPTFAKQVQGVSPQLFDCARNCAGVMAPARHRTRRPRRDRRRAFCRMQIAAAHEEIGRAVVHLRIREVHFGQILPGIPHTMGPMTAAGTLAAAASSRDRGARPDHVSSARRNFRVNDPVSGFAVAASLPRSGAAESLNRRPVSRR